MEKSPEAFRTISEVADWLGVPTHVLRFWESRFTQVKPVKRAGGRRYYRPSDMLLIGGVKRLLHDDGMTIRGVQKLLREEGVKHVASFSQPLDSEVPMKDVTAPEESASPMAVDVAPEPVDNVVPMREAAGEPIQEPGDEAVPDLAFLRRPASGTSVPGSGERPVPKSGAVTGAAPEPPAPDLFSSSRTAPPPEAAAKDEAPKRPHIPPTPEVAATDPSDDEPHFSSPPGLPARLRLALRAGRKMDQAVLAKAVGDLRALRERLRA